VRFELENSNQNQENEGDLSTDDLSSITKYSLSNIEEEVIRSSILDQLKNGFQMVKSNIVSPHNLLRHQFTDDDNEDSSQETEEKEQTSRKKKKRKKKVVENKNDQNDEEENQESDIEIQLEEEENDKIEDDQKSGILKRFYEIVGCDIVVTSIEKIGSSSSEKAIRFYKNSDLKFFCSSL